MTDVPKKAIDKITFRDIQQWILKEHNQKVSNSSISQVMAKCGLTGLNNGVKGEMPVNVSTNKEKLVLEAFKAFGLINGYERAVSK